jgi:hypothetical protein
MMDSPKAQTVSPNRYKIITFRVDQDTYDVLRGLLDRERAARPFDFVSRSNLMRRLVLAEGHRVC